MMTQEEMRNKVQEELEHISESPEPQNYLRAAYQQMRMHSLGEKAEKKQSAKEVLQSCIEILRKDYPDFEFSYDEEFFNQRD